MEEVLKSMKHKRDGRGNVVFGEPEFKVFDYIQGDVTKEISLRSKNIRLT